RSTSTVAEARYRFGSESAVAIAAANTATKTRMPTHLRRRQASSTVSTLRPDGTSVSYSSGCFIRPEIPESASDGSERERCRNQAGEHHHADHGTAIQELRKRQDAIV